jgi:hypothetical protein
MSSINAQAGNSTNFTALISAGDNTATLAFQTNGVTALNINSNQNANCTTTGSFIVPIGTTAQRPASPVNGMVRFNTTNNVLEGYANNTWVGFLSYTTYNISYLLVAGGAGGGYGRGGGGGGGGLLTSTTSFLQGTTYTVTVGAGGAAGGSTTNGVNGSNSSITGLTSAIGGGGGGSNGSTQYQ